MEKCERLKVRAIITTEELQAKQVSIRFVFLNDHSGSVQRMN